MRMVYNESYKLRGVWAFTIQCIKLIDTKNKPLFLVKSNLPEHFTSAISENINSPLVRNSVAGVDESLAIKFLEMSIDDLIENHESELWKFRFWDEITDRYFELIEKAELTISKRNVYGNNWRYVYGSGLDKPYLLCTAFHIDSIIKSGKLYPTKKESLRRRYRKTFEKALPPQNRRVINNYIEFYYLFDEFVEYRKKQVHFIAGLNNGNLQMAINLSA